MVTEHSGSFHDNILDIDIFIDEHDSISPECVENLNAVIRATDAKIVISSDWRLFLSLDDLKKLLHCQGVVGEIIDTTTMDYSYCREVQIKYWLLKNDAESWAVVDDMPLEIDNFVQTDSCFGITQKEASGLIAVLQHNK